jgi:hypothetical protein
LESDEMRAEGRAQTITVEPEDRFYRLYSKFHPNPSGGPPKAGKPVWFCRAGDCRFDLNRIEQGGTYYLAESPEGAYLEVFGRYRGKAVSEDDLRARKLAEVSLAEPETQAFNMTSSANFSLPECPPEVRHETGPPYPLSQVFAVSVFEDQYLDGIWYVSVKDPPTEWRNLAVFSEHASQDFAEGEDPNEKNFQIHQDREVPRYLAYEMHDKYGIPFTRGARTYGKR